MAVLGSRVGDVMALQLQQQVEVQGEVDLGAMVVTLEWPCRDQEDRVFDP
jgi:hypothetical protein